MRTAQCEAIVLTVTLFRAALLTPLNGLGFSLQFLVLAERWGAHLAR